MAHISSSGILPYSSLAKRITARAELYPIVLISAQLRAEDVTTNTIEYALPKRTSDSARQVLSEGPESDTLVDHATELADLRNWRTGLHSGSRHVVEGLVMGEAQS